MTGRVSNFHEELACEIPRTVELCIRDKDRFPCLGVIHRLEPDGRIYCTRCGGKEPGAVYVRQTS